MKKYSVKIEPEAFDDIKSITSWYNQAQAGLGDRFLNMVINQIDSLKTNPQVYAIRYKEIRCITVEKFPYMVHYYFNDETKTSEVLAVISTSRNPRIWEEKSKKR